MLKALHADAVEVYDSIANLSKVCIMLKDPNIRVYEIEISLNSAFKPMLADKVDNNEIESQMGNQSFYIEVKYDGERMQAHMGSDGQFKFYSRNGFDFTEEFGAKPSDGKFSKYIKDALASNVESIILDGEICPYNHQTASLAQKSEQMNIRQLKDNDPMFQQCLYIYDVVYLNGQVLTNKPFKERLEILQTVIKTEIKGRIYMAERRLASSKSDVIDALNDAIDLRQEGIMVKDPNSVYKPGARSKSGWIKIKPDYNTDLMDTCDLVVLGGYYSTGRKVSVGLVSHFLLGVKDGPNFRSFTRVGSGYSDKELFELLQRLQPRFQKKPVKNVNVRKDKPKGLDKPDVWVDPRHSVILQVKAAEIVKSDSYDVGCTLR
jgi:DNA ligase-4